MQATTKKKRNRENARKTTSRKANSNARGYLGQGKLDEDRERRGQDRRTTGLEARVEREYQRGTERRRRWPKALDGAPWVRPDQCTCMVLLGEDGGERAEGEGSNRLRAEAHGAVERVIGCGA